MKRAMSLGGVPEDAAEVRNVVCCIAISQYPWM